MQTSNTFDRLRTLEEEGRYFDIKVGDIRIWHLIRRPIHVYLAGSNLNVSGVELRGGILAKFKVACRFLINILFRNDSRCKSADILAFASSRRILVNGKLMHPQIDSFIADLNCKVSLIERFSCKYPYVRNEYGTYTSDWMEFKRLVNRRFTKQTFSKEDIANITAIANDIKDAFSIDVEKLIFSLIRSIMSDYNLCYKHYDSLLRRVNPKCIVIVCSYDRSMLILSKVARDRDIKTVELEHGVSIGKHFAYNICEDANPEYLPQAFLRYGEASMEATRFPSNAIEQVVVGNPFFELLSCSNKHAITQDNKNILIVSQSVDNLRAPMRTLVLELAVKLPDYTIIVRPHPAEMDVGTFYKEFKNHSNITLDRSGNIYDAMNNVDAVVGISSTTLYEAIGVKKRVFVLKRDEHDDAYYLYENGLAEAVNNADELVQKLLDESPRIDDSAIEKIFKSNAKANMLAYFREVLK